MSVGCFVGPIASSYIDEAHESTDAFARCIDLVLKKNGLPGYSEPVGSPDIYSGGLFGRSDLDHHSARCLVELAELGKANGCSPHLGLIANNPYRVTFVPTDFPWPLPTGHFETIWNENVEIWVGSAPRLLSDLMSIAPALGIPLVGNHVENVVAKKINDFAPLYAGDDCTLAEDDRTAWLLLHEGARLAVLHSVPLNLAG